MKAQFHLTLQKRRLEFVVALYALVWGLWLLSPFWNAFPSSGVFSEMQALAPQWVWGASVTSIALFQMLVLLTNNVSLRLVSSFITMFLFISLSILAAFGNYQSTAAPTYFVMGVCAWLAYTELLVDKKKG